MCLFNLFLVITFLKVIFETPLRWKELEVAQAYEVLFYVGWIGVISMIQGDLYINNFLKACIEQFFNSQMKF